MTDSVLGGGSMMVIPPPDWNFAMKTAMFHFIDPSNRSLKDLQIPSELMLDRLDVAWMTLTIGRDNGDYVQLRGNVTQLKGLSAVQASEVPEPASIFIFTLALAAAGFFAWRNMPR